MAEQELTDRFGQRAAMDAAIAAALGVPIGGAAVATNGRVVLAHVPGDGGAPPVEAFIAADFQLTQVNSHVYHIQV
jgi:hypothetical protein